MRWSEWRRLFNFFVSLKNPQKFRSKRKNYEYCPECRKAFSPTIIILSSVLCSLRLCCEISRIVFFAAAARKESHYCMEWLLSWSSVLAIVLPSHQFSDQTCFSSKSSFAATTATDDGLAWTFRGEMKEGFTYIGNGSNCAHCGLRSIVNPTDAWCGWTSAGTGTRNSTAVSKSMATNL